MFRSLLIANASKKSGGLLPDGYTQLEYISIINNQVQGHNNNFRLPIFFEQVDKIEMGVSAYSDIYINAMFVAGYLNNFDSPYVTLLNSGEYKVVDLIDYNITPEFASKQDFIESGKQIITLTYTGVKETKLNRYMSFGSWSDSNYSTSLNWYGVKIYKSEVIIANLIPCKNPSGEVGMYDLVSKQFFGNNGTGSFTAGPEIVELPSGYKSIPSVYSNGDYFLTGIKTSQDIKATVTFKTTQIPKFLFGVRDGQLKNGLVIYLNGTTNFVAFGGGLTSYPTTVNTADGKYHTIVLSETEYTIDDEAQTRSNVVQFAAFYEIGCGTLVGYDGNPDGRNFIGNMSEFKLENSSGMLMDLKPVVREADGIVGFYDTVSKNFFTGVNGEFSIGD